MTSHTYYVVYEDMFCRLSMENSSLSMSPPVEAPHPNNPADVTGILRVTPDRDRRREEEYRYLLMNILIYTLICHVKETLGGEERRGETQGDC